MVEEPRAGLRERKKRQTRLALSTAAIRLSVERGAGNVTIEDIAAAADVSVRTFRNYFTSKAEAIAGMHLDRMLAIADDLRGRPAEEPLWDAITEAVIAHFAPGQPEADHDAQRKRVDAIRLMLTDPSLQGELARANDAARTAVAAAVAERTGTDAEQDLYPKLVAAAVGSATAVATEHWLQCEPGAQVTALLREAFDRVRAGLPVP
ncbi:TetR family transcriptional regulator [Saccharopolyspora erythraea D]|uniref:acyl-CoA-like ligand-binding transcription factor n=1 Tax=Saccharopolyspora erythraea TaxID=1836 RepID=UPI00038D9480|nr:TetR family transcriptional regulator [Saccharopolyspora erythraea]EQD83153.1 TetR family transcriptional regulator [Saccharopolyspora erythraea D]